MNTYFTHGFMSSGFINLSPKEAYLEITENNAIIVDVREKYIIGYKFFDIQNIIYMPKSKLIKKYSLLPKNKPLIIADSVGLRSHEVIVYLIEKGFNNVANLVGGILDWEHDNLPIKIDKTKQLSGSCMCQLRQRNKNKTTKF